MRLAATLAALCLAAALHAESLPIEALPADFLRGERPAAWPEDEVTVVECWARWCGPCVRAMPHLEELHQELKDEGVHIIGLNVWDRGTDAEILDFLSKQPTPPTYAIAIDRAGALPKRLGVKGIPHAIVVREGEIVWQGHPASLTVEKLRAWRDERKAKVEQKADPLAATLDLEAQADAAAAKGDWVAAVDLQRRALAAHPLAAKAGRLPSFDGAAPVLPKLDPPAPTATSAEGDAAPYATLLGAPLPADDVPTVLAYWPNPFWIAKLNWTTLSTFPDRRVDKALPYAHRTIVVMPDHTRLHLEKLLAPLAWRGIDLRFVLGDPRDLFGFNGRNDPPFIAYFRDGRLLWKGPLEVMPAALRAPTPPADPEALQTALAAEKETQDFFGALFRELRTADAATRDAWLREAAKRPIPRGWGTLLVPQFLATPYQAKDLSEGKRRLAWAMKTFHNDPGALEMLRKVIDAWPELSLEVPAERSRIAERLGELNDRDEPAYAQAWFAVAAEEAERAGDTARAKMLYGRALEVSPAACRLRQFQSKLPALSTR